MDSEPPDPAAVAAQQKRMQKFAVGGGVALVVGLALFGVNWYRETRAILARRERKLEPWEVAAREEGLG